MLLLLNSDHGAMKKA